MGFEILAQRNIEFLLEIEVLRLQAPMWALPVFAFAISALLAIAVPLLLKPGSDAFNEQRNDIGVFSDKNHPFEKK
jgi:hypothetical protein